MPRAAYDVDELRERLLEHARGLVATQGPGGLTMRSLANEAGTAVGLSYKAFPSRDELLHELTRRSLDELNARIDEWSARPGGDLAERILEFADLHLDSLAPMLVAHVSAQARGDEFLREAAARGATRSWASVMSEFLAARQRSGEIRADADVPAFGFVLTAAIHDVLTTAAPLSPPDRPTLARHVRGVAALLTSTGDGGHPAASR